MAIDNQREKNSVEVRTSRYVQGGDTDRYANRLSWWERRLMEKQDDDIRIVIDSSIEKRPDLIAYRAYRKVGLMWLVLQYNNIVDIETELVNGKEIFLPSERRVMFNITTNPTGGNVIS